MPLGVIRKIGILTALLSVVIAYPISAQMFSDGYEFLKAVKDRDGDAVTEMLNEPGTTVVNARDLTSRRVGIAHCNRPPRRIVDQISHPTRC